METLTPLAVMLSTKTRSDRELTSNCKLEDAEQAYVALIIAERAGYESMMGGTPVTT